MLFLSCIPSILVESRFLTNPHDVKLLRKSEYLESAAANIARGVLRYREGVENYAGVAAGPPAESSR